MLEIKKSTQSDNIEIMRSLIKDRGRYLYFLVDAARKKGLPWEEFAREALSRYGCLRFQEAFANIENLDEFAEAYLSDTTKKIFDSDLLEREEDYLVIKAGYCPLMHAWVECCGDDDDYVAKLCDIAMDGDRAMVNSIPALDFSLRRSLAFGDHQCEFLVELAKEEKA